MPMIMQRLHLRENHSLMHYAFFLANHAILPMLKDIACYVFTKHLKRHPLCSLLVKKTKLHNFIFVRLYVRESKGKILPLLCQEMADRMKIVGRL